MICKQSVSKRKTVAWLFFFSKTFYLLWTGGVPPGRPQVEISMEKEK